LDPDPESAFLIRIWIQGVKFNADPCGSGSLDKTFKEITDKKALLFEIFVVVLTLQLGCRKKKN